MSFRRAGGAFPVLSTVLTPFLLGACALAQASPEEVPDGALVLACSQEALVAGPRDSVRLSAVAAGAGVGPVTRVRWTAEHGEIDGEGSEAVWTLPAAEPGYYAATATATDAEGATASCSITVWLREGAKGSGGPGRLNRRSLLACDPAPRAGAGYGLYSYLLLPRTPTSATRPRYDAAFEAFLRIHEELAEFQEGSRRKQLNVVYLPVTAAALSTVPLPSGAAAVDWVRESYHYECADRLLSEVPEATGAGPYIVSVRRPLGDEGALSSGYLFFDLSRAPPELVDLWFREFLRTSARQESFEDPTGPRLALQLRTLIGHLGTGTEEALAAIVAWKGSL